jgi:hypothetical protein
MRSTRDYDSAVAPGQIFGIVCMNRLMRILAPVGVG